MNLYDVLQKKNILLKQRIPLLEKKYSLLRAKQFHYKFAEKGEFVKMILLSKFFLLNDKILVNLDLYFYTYESFFFNFVDLDRFLKEFYYYNSSGIVRSYIREGTIKNFNAAFFENFKETKDVRFLNYYDCFHYWSTFTFKYDKYHKAYAHFMRNFFFKFE